MSAEIIFIVNPTAARGRVGRRLASLESQIEEFSLKKATLMVTKKPEDAENFARSAPDGSRIIAVGGDGTVNGVARGILGSSKTLGVLPVGSGNDFARMMGIANLSLEDSIRHACTAPEEQIDLIFLNGTPSVSNIAIGFDALVTQNSSKTPKFMVGMLRYLYALLTTISSLKLPRAELKIDGQLVYSGKTLLVACMNSVAYGGGIPISPGALFDDGKISVVLGKDLSKLESLQILPQLLKGTHLQNPKVKIFEAETVDIEFDSVVCMAVDGELLKPGRICQVSIKPHYLKVVSRVLAKTS